MRRWPLAVLWCGSIATAACDEGIARDESQLRSTIIGAYLARNAGTGLINAVNNNSPLQRLLELAHAGRNGAPDTVVNEAVAMEMGYICNNYVQLQPGLLGCVASNIPTYIWKSPNEVRNAAEKLGFVCEPTRDDSVACAYHGSVIQHPVRFSILPSIDGVRSGADSTVQETAHLYFKQGRPPIMDVVESTSR